jgi:uncharacterized membrane protein YphA (DoxX/SURF4 family)
VKHQVNSATTAPALSKPALPGHWLEYTGLLTRWFLGGTFVYMGFTKALHPEMFLKLLRQYDLTGNSFLLNSIAAGLPWFEVFCGLLLLAGIAVRGSSLLLLLMLVPFTFVVFKRALAVADLQHIALCAVRFDCGCGNGEVLICRKIVENGLLMLLSCAPLAGVGRPFAVRFSLSDSGEP